MPLLPKEKMHFINYSHFQTYNNAKWNDTMITFYGREGVSVFLRKFSDAVIKGQVFIYFLFLNCVCLWIVYIHKYITYNQNKVLYVIFELNGTRETRVQLQVPPSRTQTVGRHQWCMMVIVTGCVLYYHGVVQ